MEQYSRNTKKGKPPAVYLLSLFDDDARKDLIQGLSYDSIDQCCNDIRQLARRLPWHITFRIEVREKKSWEA